VNLEEVSVSADAERDYVLGTHDEEIARLGLQHRVWRPSVLDCWFRAGITAGSRVMDVGAGPGYATIDLAEIVGPAGEVIAVDRSARFLQAAASMCKQRDLSNVRLHELDLMTDSWPAERQDAVSYLIGTPSADVAVSTTAVVLSGVVF